MLRTPDRTDRQRRRTPNWLRSAGLCATSAAVLGAAESAQAQALAGREIVNVASVSFVVDGKRGTAESNPARDRVSEIIEVGATAVHDTPTPAADGERDRAVAFRLTNAGNGPERFALTVSSASSDDPSSAPACRRAAFDSDGDGAYGPADGVYAPGSEPVLPPGKSVVVFALCNVPETVSDGQLAAVTLTAVALTGVGAPGTVFSARGENGVDALTGRSSGSATARTGLIVALGRPELIKTHSVRDPSGGARVVPGAVITYTLTARLTGRGVARDVRIADPVPAGATYVPGSLRLDGQAVSDASDADSGEFNGEQVQIVLGELEPSRVRSFDFQVRIN